jgi:diadenosine tetraphosphate (Ap4A) HIT family hydrolase
MAPMPENPHALHARSVTALRTPPVEEWDSWPFTGGVDVKALRAPEPEPTRQGENGVDCPGCTKPDSDYFWTDDTWRMMALPATGLPFVGIVEPRVHVDAPSELDDAMAGQMGVMIARAERAVASLDGVGRVHIGRWGEGAEHMHWWFMARPQGLVQTASCFAVIWDDILPPVPEDVWSANVAHVKAAMEASA